MLKYAFGSLRGRCGLLQSSHVLVLCICWN